MKIFVLVVAVVVGYFYWFLNQQKPPAYSELKSYAEHDNIVSGWTMERKKKAINNFSKVLTFQTFTYEENKEEFQKTFQYLKETFPLLHSTLTLEKVGPYESLLYTWKGKTDKRPILFTAHIDVVPTPDIEKWTNHPFLGKVENGYIYGRGTLDVKVNVMAIMESVEELLKKNYQPERTIYLSFGCDEELGGFKGAKLITELLESRGVQLDFVHDEGGFIVDGIFPSISKPIAMITTCEKSFINVELNITCDPGHSSIPERESCIGILSNSIVNLENNQMKSNVANGVFNQFMNHIAPFSEFRLVRFILGHSILFSPLLSFAFSKIKTTNALIRTTTAFTRFNSGVKDNVLPSTASANVNFRIHPNDDLNKLKDHIASQIDPRIQVTFQQLERLKQHPIACVDCTPFRVIYKTIDKLFPNQLILTPNLFIAGSDSAHYRKISKNSYGFSPFWITKEDVNKIHGFDERISEENYK